MSEYLLIRECNPALPLSPVQYQLPGASKKPRTAWFAPDMVANSKAWLEQKLGPLTHWAPPGAQPSRAEPDNGITVLTDDPSFQYEPKPLTPDDQAKLAAPDAVRTELEQIADALESR
jgi:hypothetical protein